MISTEQQPLAASREHLDVMSSWLPSRIGVHTIAIWPEVSTADLWVLLSPTTRDPATVSPG